MKIYVYKLTSDDDGAPHVTDDLLSLAICKPMIRSTASPGNQETEGDIIFGFGSNDMQNRLVYVAEVTEKHTHGKYYDIPEYMNRADCIYEWRSDGMLIWRKGAAYHKHNQGADRDIGHHRNNYKKANVLLSRNFKYFGNANYQDYRKYRDLFPFVHKLGQGHRVNSYSSAIEQQLLNLKAELLNGKGQMKVGKSSHIPSGALHNEECGSCMIKHGVIRPGCGC